jgi:hypothetical protein
MTLLNVEGSYELRFCVSALGRLGLKAALVAGLILSPAFAGSNYILSPTDKAVVDALPWPRLFKIDLSGSCRNTDIEFADEKARAGWTAPSYGLPLRLWAISRAGPRVGTSNPECADMTLAVKLWQSAIGSPITGRLSKQDVFQFVSIVDAHDPRYAQAGHSSMKSSARRLPLANDKHGNQPNESDSKYGVIGSAGESSRSKQEQVIQRTASQHEPDFQLLAAARSGDSAAVRYAITNGADVEARNLEGWTPLMLASINGHLDIMKYLLANGADINRVNPNQSRMKAIHAAAITGQLGSVKVLISNGANINDRNPETGATPLLMALAGGHQDVIDFLEKSGAKE